MKIKKLLLVSALSVAVSAPAFAMEGTPGQMYGGISYTIANVSLDDQVDSGNSYSLDDYSLSLLNFHLGVYLHKNFSLEGRFGFGVGDDSSNIKVNGVDSGVPLTLEADRAFGVYGVGHANLTSNFGAYALVGWSSVSATYSSSVTSFSLNDESGFSFGGGLEYAFTPSTSVRAEYMSYLRGSDYDVNTFSIGLNQKF